MTTPSPTTPPVSPIDELRHRWGLARRAALRTLVPDADEDLEEVALVSVASARDPEAALKRVFDNSRILGLGFRRYYRVDLTLVDLADMLPALGVPCHARGFVRAENEAAWRTAGVPCTAVPGSALCGHWRESVLGLVGGISSAVCYTRLESPGSGGNACVDLLHVDPESPLRFVPVGAELQVGLDAVSHLIHRIQPDAKLVFLGIVEGALHYRFQASRGGCGVRAQTPSGDEDLLDLAGVGSAPAGGFDVGVVLASALRRRFPTLRVCDASPRPVLSENS